MPVNQKTNKHSRIIQRSHFIRNNFVFRKDYDYGSPYDLAMQEMFSYMKDNSQNKKTKDIGYDSPDSIALLSALAEDLIPDRWF